jgi:O-antigen/teichoic acid export membrane protein
LRLAVFDNRPNPSWRQSSLVLNTGLTFVSLAFLAASMLVASTLASRALGRSDRGILALLVLVPTVLHVILDLGVEQGLTVKVANGSIAAPDRRSVLRGIVSHGSIALVVAAIISTLAPLAGSSSIAALGGRNAPLTVVACSFAVVQRDLTGWLYGHNRIPFVSLARMAGASLVAGGSAILYALGSTSVSGYFSVYVAGTAVVTVMLALKLHATLPRSSHELARQSIDWRMISRTGLPFYGASLSYYVVSRFDSFLLGATRPPAELGLYSNAVNLAEIIWYFPGALGQALLPHAAGKGDPRLCRKTIVVVLILSTVTMMVLALSGQFLISTLFGPSFTASFTSLLLLLPGAVGMSCMRIGEIWLLIYGRAEVVRTINTIAACTGAVLWWATIPRYGLNAAAVVSSILYCSMGLASILVLMRMIRAESRELRS